MLVDLHTHTSLCNHASGTPGEYLEAAVRAGISFYGVSDHCPWPAGYDSAWRMTPALFPEYRKIVADLKEQGESCGVKVLYGLEVDWVPGRMDEVRANLDNEPLDYIAGSIHYLDSFAFDNPDEIHRWQDLGADRVWKSYADEMCRFIQDYRFSFLSHFDLPKKFGFYPQNMASFNLAARGIFELAAEKGVAIELNTSGLRRKVNEIYPSFELLKSAAEAGMMITLGSDAHAPDEVGSGFDAAVEMARRAGYKTLVAFEEMRPFEVPLD